MDIETLAKTIAYVVIATLSVALGVWLLIELPLWAAPLMFGVAVFLGWFSWGRLSPLRHSVSRPSSKQPRGWLAIAVLALDLLAGVGNPVTEFIDAQLVNLTRLHPEPPR